jgi:hypothetical protein
MNVENTILYLGRPRGPGGRGVQRTQVININLERVALEPSRENNTRTLNTPFPQNNTTTSLRILKLRHLGSQNVPTICTKTNEAPFRLVTNHSHGEIMGLGRSSPSTQNRILGSCILETWPILVVATCPAAGPCAWYTR